MVKLEFELEVVTPTFIGGAIPEASNLYSEGLRPPSLRGMLRGWCRAALGAVTAGDAERIREIDRDLWGITEMAAPLALRSRVLEMSAELISESAYRQDRSGIRYLDYSMAMRTRPFIRPESKFLVGLLRRPYRAAPAEALEAAAGALWLMLHLGGVGARATRGFGILRAVKEPKGDSLPSFKAKTKSATELKEFLEDGLQKVRTIYARLAGSDRSPRQQPAFPVVAPKWTEIYLTDTTWTSWEDCLDEIGLAFRDFRHLRQPDYDEMKAFLSGEEQDEVHLSRVLFGLPLQFRYRSLGGARGWVQPEHYRHRPSPFHIRVAPLGAGRVCAMFLVFKEQFLPPEERIIARAQRMRAEVTVVGNVIEEFLTEIGSRFGLVPVSVGK